MPCMCGDTHCPSCGPAQGNFRCPICNAWADDCCEHFDEETGELKPEFKAAANEAIAKENEMWDAYAADLEREREAGAKLAASWEEYQREVNRDLDPERGE